MKRFILKLSLCLMIFPSVLGQDIDCLSKKNGAIPNYEDHKEILSLFTNNDLDSISHKSDCNNSKARMIFKERIDIIKQYHKSKENIDISWIMDIILNFEILTKIESESDGNYIGKYQPTSRDLERWEEWHEKYKDKICWYEEKRVLYLIE